MVISPNQYIFTTKYVIRNHSLVICVLHEEDGDWQFLGKEENLNDEDAMIISLGEMLEHDSTLREITSLPPGYKATRDNLSSPWKIDSI